MDNRKEFLRDPFRAAMMALPKVRGLAALCAAVCAVFFFGALRILDASNMAEAPLVALCGAAGVVILFFGLAGAMKGEKQPVVVWLWLAILCVVAVAAHLAMLDIKPGRYTKTLAPLFEDMWNYDLGVAMAWADDGWSGVFLIVCALISRLETFSQLYAVKLVDMICQCLCGAAAARLVRVRGGKAAAAVGALLACVLAPTMLFNAGCWAQCDATFAMFTLWGLYFLLSERPLAGCVLWGLALATKLQSAFLFPLLIVLFMNRKLGLGHILALLAAALLSQIAILLDGQSLMELIGRYAVQIANVTENAGLADVAPGVFSLMNVASVREFSGMGLYLGIAAALVVVAALLRARREISRETLLLAALLLACGLPLILPQMNARSLYLAGMLAFCMADTPKRLAVALGLEIISLCCYMQAIFNRIIMPLNVLSLLAIAVAVVAALELIPQLLGGREAQA